jgi:hypothetical protein
MAHTIHQACKAHSQRWSLRARERGGARREHARGIRPSSVSSRNPVGDRRGDRSHWCGRRGAGHDRALPRPDGGVPPAGGRPLSSGWRAGRRPARRAAARASTTRSPRPCGGAQNHRRREAPSPQDPRHQTKGLGRRAPGALTIGVRHAVGHPREGTRASGGLAGHNNLSALRSRALPHGRLSRRPPAGRAGGTAA